MKSFLLGLIIFSTLVNGDQDDSEWSENPELFQGDIVLTPRQKAELFGASSRSRRQVYYDGRWTNGTVPFHFDPNLDATTKYLFKKAMKLISDRTCVTFVERNDRNRLHLVFETGCSSSVGRIGGVQKVRVGPGCYVIGNFAHELFHALGIIHTMARYDRDDYMIVQYDQMTGSDLGNFGKYSEYSTYNAIPFEYSSAMNYHGRPLAHSKDPIYQQGMGARFVTFYDYQAINSNYECQCANDPGCKNGGVPNSKKCSECVCPAGYGGKLCDKGSDEFLKKLTAEPDWKEYNVKFGSIGIWESEFKTHTMFIEAPHDKTIQVQITRMDRFYCSTGVCNRNSVEIKYMGDPRYTNPLFCCYFQKEWNATYTSKLNPTPVILRSTGGQVNFGMKFRYINGSVHDLPKTNNTYDSFEYPL